MTEINTIDNLIKRQIRQREEDERERKIRDAEKALQRIKEETSTVSYIYAYPSEDFMKSEYFPTICFTYLQKGKNNEELKVRDRIILRDRPCSDFYSLSKDSKDIIKQVAIALLEDYIKYMK